jgi:hypothetical protein
MQIPLQITFHGIDHSNALEERIREKALKLEQIYDKITSCRVVVEPHHPRADQYRQDPSRDRAHAGPRLGMIGFPLRLLARENYDRIVALKGARAPSR